MRIAILAITNQGKVTARKIHSVLPGSQIVVSSQGIRKCIEDAWYRYDGIICIMAAGIVVRCIGKLCRSKFDDPAIVVVDEQCRFAISLLSGHVGGANYIVTKLQQLCGVQAVVTTGSDVAGHTSVDLWALENGLAIANPRRLASCAATLLNRGLLSVYQEQNYLNLYPADFKQSNHPELADIVISVKNKISSNGLHLVPRVLYIGLGCRRGATVEEFQEALDDVVSQYNIHLEAVAGIASIDIKKDEAGLLELAEKYAWPLTFYSTDKIHAILPPSKSSKVFEKIGVHGVCEPAAILAASQGAQPGKLIIGKIKWKRITAAIALQASSMS